MNISENKKEVIAIIPARGGSKGIPRKNIVDLCGKPLIAYTIQAALKTELITRVIVSSDDEEIAEISRQYGAEVPFLRPKKISGDNASLGDAFAYTLEQLSQNGYVPDITIELYPTHPFRTPEFINELVQILINGYRSVLTVKQITHSAHTVFYKDEKDFLHSLLNNEYVSPVSKRSFFRSYGLFVGYNRFGKFGDYIYEVTEPIALIDIDTYSDLYFAEEVIKNNLYDFKL